LLTAFSQFCQRRAPIERHFNAAIHYSLQRNRREARRLDMVKAMLSQLDNLNRLPMAYRVTYCDAVI
jgi:hypothetical protein